MNEKPAFRRPKMTSSKKTINGKISRLFATASALSLDCHWTMALMLLFMLPILGLRYASRPVRRWFRR